MTTQHTIKIEQTLSCQFLSDVLICAFDGSHGGSWHWAAGVNNESRQLVSPHFAINKETEQWMAVIIYPDETGNKVWDAAGQNGAKIDHAVLVTGIQRILDGDVQYSSDTVRDDVARAVLEGDPCDIDAIAADQIVQAGWFGQVVFG
jgi:hypothetical protein